jgi:hypothetical protein
MHEEARRFDIELFADFFAESTPSPCRRRRTDTMPVHGDNRQCITMAVSSRIGSGFSI